MELDELKYLLTHQQSPERSTQQLADALSVKSNSVLDKIKRSIRLEMVCAVIFTIMAIVWIVYSDLLFYKALSVYIIIFCTGFFIYIDQLRKRINTYRSQVGSAKRSLEDIINILQTFIRSYFNLTMLMLPVIAIMGIVTLNSDSIALSTRAWTIYGIWFVVWTIFMYFFTKWYLRKLYGRYHEELKEQLRDISSDD